MESSTDVHDGSDLDLHSAIGRDDGECATNTAGRTDSSNGGAETLDNPSLMSSDHESKPSPEQIQRSIAPNDLRKPSSGFWEIDVSGSAKDAGSTPSSSSMPRPDEDLNQKPAHPEDHDESDRIEVGKSNTNHHRSRSESGNSERESQTYTASNYSMTSPALESSTGEKNHPSTENIPVSSMPKNENSIIDGERHCTSASPGQSGELAAQSGPATQYPLTQVTKHPADSASPSSYTIPSHVFDRKTTNPVEWSAASNESLFSIHMGNMSFSKDMSLLGKNDEFDKFGERSMPTNVSGPLTAEVPSNHSSSDQISNNICVMLDESRTTAARTEDMSMREVVRENPVHPQGIPRVVTGVKPSRRSDANKQSFAFPILTDVQRNSSATTNQDDKEVQTQPQTTEELPNEVQEPKSAKAGSSSGRRWFSCFCCGGS